MAHAEKAYLPAAGHDWALPFYDPITKLLGSDKVHRELLRQAAFQSHHHVLDIGCGTGTLATEIKRLYPTVEVTGLDPDPKALARARRKAERAGVAIRFEQGFAGELSFPDASFDRVFSSLMFHHLPADEREKTLREVRRVLAPHGSLHLVDFSRPDQHAHGLLAHLIHSSHHLTDNSDERILALMQQAGFTSATKAGSGAMLFGLLHISYFRAAVRGK
jgi:ubiquinone/menaquinone biosynthesis C-methylase UbiE